MAYNTNPGRQEFTATASQTDFNFNFKIFETSDVKVYQTPSGQTPDDATDILTETIHYTVTINGDNGGTVQLVTGAGVGDSITLERDLPIKRDFDYQQSGDFFADDVDADQEYQTYLIADRETKESRTITLPQAVQGVSTVLPSPLADQYLKWNSSGDAIENDTTIPDNVQLAKDWANKAEDVIVADGEYSSKHYATKSSASATAAETAQAAAETAQANTEQILDNFDDKYLGSKASDPTLDNDGNPLTDGALYFNTTSNTMKVYDLGNTNWIEIPQIYLSALQDVQLTSVTSGDILQWNGTRWINYNLLGSNNTFTASQRGTITTDNDLSFDMNVTNNFVCTPTTTGSLTFTNITSGQSGNILLINTTPQVITLPSTTYMSADDLTLINTAGTYWLSYYSDGTNVYVSASKALTSAGA